MKLKIIFYAFIAMLAIWGCSTDDGEDYCYYSTNTGIDEVTGPEATTVDVPIVLQVKFRITNGCGQFARFVESNEFPKDIYARVNYAGCICTDILQEITEPYTFQASQAGEYVLRFVKPDETFIVKTITVTEQ